MNAAFRKLLTTLGEVFWLVPAILVAFGILLARVLLQVDRSGVLPKWLIDHAWLYNGGATGARTLLGAVASSTIGVAGTVFSITIAALSLAAGQMGPRLLRNFTHDRGNQITLGTFLGTFSYTLMVLQSVRTESEGVFVPSLSLTVSVLFAFVCVGMLVFFVGHMAGRINVDTVVELVSNDVSAAIRRLTYLEPAPQASLPATFLDAAIIVRDPRHGYLQQLDREGLATWAAERGTVLQLRVRPGGYVFPGAAIALMHPEVPGAQAAILDATALCPARASKADLEFAIRQLVEVGVRALSPGINDPHTAMAVIDRLGSALCDIAPRHLDPGVVIRDGRPALFVPPVDYDGLVDAMFCMIRQNAATSVAVFIRLIEVLTKVCECDRDPARLATLARHASQAVTDARARIDNVGDLADIARRHAAFAEVWRTGLPHAADQARSRRGEPV